MTMDTMRRWMASLAVLIGFLTPTLELPAEEPSGIRSSDQAAGEIESGARLQTIQWSVLAPEDGRPFNDPFSKLTQRQLSDLSYVVRVRRLIDEKKIKVDGVDAVEATVLASKLAGKGFDIGWLMAQRQRVMQIRQMQVESMAKSIVKSLGNKDVMLTGYVMPINVIQQQMTEFFLVPTRASCSNEVAPSPLQAIFVAVEKGIEGVKKGAPLRVTGKVRAMPISRTIRNGIGLLTVQSAYTMPDPAIEVYAQSDE